MLIFKFYLKTLCCIIAGCLIAGNAFADVDFSKLYGSDLGMGIGAKAIGFGGSFVAVADDASAVYWNPAGLTTLNHTRLFFSADGPGDFSCASLILSPDISFFKTMDLKIGVSYIRRLRFKGDSSRDDWSGYPSHLLDLAMVDVGEAFSGQINSTTDDFRVSLAFSPPGMQELSFGVNYIFLK